MPIDQETNNKLKEMWRLDKLIMEGNLLTDEERLYYNKNMHVIQQHYSKNHEYWKNRHLELGL
jgi:hypothetical protein